MAISLLLMFGRVGGIVGINSTAALLIDYCDTYYIINAVGLLIAAIVCYTVLKKM